MQDIDGLKDPNSLQKQYSLPPQIPETIQDQPQMYLDSEENSESLLNENKNELIDDVKEINDNDDENCEDDDTKDFSNTFDLIK